VVTVRIAGTVIVTLPVLLVSATEVAVIVTDCAELVAAGAVKVAPEVEVLVKEVEGAPLTLQVTPSGVLPVVLSLVTVALSVNVSVPSTVDTDAVTVTPTGLELPPQPARSDDTAKVTASRDNRLQNI
jgi:hypothetical protein